MPDYLTRKQLRTIRCQPIRVAIVTEERIPASASHIWQATDSKVIDLNNRSDSIWLRNHMRWAARNNHRVTITPQNLIN